MAIDPLDQSRQRLRRRGRIGFRTDQRHQGLPFEEHRRLGHAGPPGEAALDRFGEDVLAVRKDQNLLLPPHQPEPSLLPSPEIPRVEPSLAVHKGQGLARSGPVAGSHRGAPNLHPPSRTPLLRRQDPDLDSGKGRTHRPDGQILRGGHGDHRRCFGESISLEHDQPHGDEVPDHLGAKGGPSRGQRLHRRTEGPGNRRKEPPARIDPPPPPKGKGEGDEPLPDQADHRGRTARDLLLDPPVEALPEERDGREKRDPVLGQDLPKGLGSEIGGEDRRSRDRQGQ